MGAEHHMLAGQRGRIDDLDRGDDFLQFGDAALDEGLAFSGGMVFGVLREIAVRARFRDLADDRRTLSRLEVAELVCQPFQAWGGHRELLHDTPSFDGPVQ
jgi:hypothetical protein